MGPLTVNFLHCAKRNSSLRKILPCFSESIVLFALYSIFIVRQFLCKAFNKYLLTRLHSGWLPSFYCNRLLAVGLKETSLLSLFFAYLHQIDSLPGSFKFALYYGFSELILIFSLLIILRPWLTYYESIFPCQCRFTQFPRNFLQFQMPGTASSNTLANVFVDNPETFLEEAAILQRYCVMSGTLSVKSSQETDSRIFIDILYCSWGFSDFQVVSRQMYVCLKHL